MKVLLAVLFLSLMAPAFAQLNEQESPTDGGALTVGFATTPDEISAGEVTKMKIEFMNPATERIQEHIDYRVVVMMGDDTVFGPIPLTHTSTGSVTIPVELPEDGTYTTIVEVEGILFQPIPMESVSFSVLVGDDAARQPPVQDNGGCLIATATYGSELAPQVQHLRETRDNIILETESGAAFMGAFNSIYYSFSPAIADLERENPAFRDVVRVGLWPMLHTLLIFDHIEIGSEQEMLAYGIGVISLNLGIYMGIPALAALELRRFGRGRRLNGRKT